MKRFLSVVLAGCAVVAVAALPGNGGYSISGVTAASQLPWDRRVIVNFTVTPPAGAPADGILRLECHPGSQLVPTTICWLPCPLNASWKIQLVCGLQMS